MSAVPQSIAVSEHVSAPATHPAPTAQPVRDRFDRPLCSLRISVIDKCNLRCRYCMPEAEYQWLPERDVLSFDEIDRLVNVFVGLGVDKVRLTGGEPLLRKELPTLVAMIAAKPQVKDIAITTNGVLLESALGDLIAAGLKRVTISLDTLDPARFRGLSQRGTHGAVLAGIAAAARSGLPDTKIDTVMMRGVNDDEIVPLIEYAKSHGAEIRFIEYMDVGGATKWKPDLVMSRREILERIAAHYGSVTPLAVDWAPADRYQLPDGATFGVISSTTEPFCATCDRSRLTADGLWYRCLYARAGTDLRTPLRSGHSDQQLTDLVGGLWSRRADRGAETRLAEEERRALLPLSVLKSDPHLEMHTRGG